MARSNYFFIYVYTMKREQAEQREIQNEQFKVQKRAATFTHVAKAHSEGGKISAIKGRPLVLHCFL